MKKNTHFIQSRFSLVIFFILLFVITGCEQPPDIRTSKASLIYPPSLLIKGLKSITLISPNNGTSYYIDDRDVNNLTFNFDGTEPYYTSVILFTDQPAVSKDGYLIDGNAKCLGGVTNMSSLHPWNDVSSVFSVNLDESAFFVCNNNSITDAFSETEKLVLDETTLKKNVPIYWAVLGYNNRYTLTHSSPIRKINIQ